MKTKNNNNLIGILSFIPPTYIVLFISLAIYLTTSVPSEEWGNIFHFIFVIHLVVMVINILLLITIGLHMAGNKKMPILHKVIWALSFILTLTLTMPIYWYKHIRKDKPIKGLGLSKIYKYQR